MTTLTQRLPRTLLLLQNSRLGRQHVSRPGQFTPATYLLHEKRQASSSSRTASRSSPQKQSPNAPQANSSSSRPSPQSQNVPTVKATSSRPSPQKQSQNAPRAKSSPSRPSPQNHTPPATKSTSSRPSPQSHTPPPPKSPPNSPSPSTPPSKLNAPLSTLPAPLIVPPRAPGQSLPKHLLTIGKTYLQFYKTGVKNIYANYKASRPIHAHLKTHYNSSLPLAIKGKGITRGEFQLLRRNRHDLVRVPVFGLVFMVCGEFTPLVVVLLSGVVPWTCRIPRQVDGDRVKLETRRQISFRNLTLPPPPPLPMTVEKGKGGNEEKGIVGGVDGLQRMQLLHISWSLGLCSSAWDWLGGQLPGLPTGVLRRRVRERMRYLEMDDWLIVEAGGIGNGMNSMEVKMACVERGIDVMNRPEGDLRADLESWLRSMESGKVGREYLLLTRPSVWPARAPSQSQSHPKPTEKNTKSRPTETKHKTSSPEKKREKVYV